MLNETNQLHSRAAFNPLIRPYLVVTGALMMAVTVVLLPLALLWICGIGQWWARHYFAKLECELTDTVLRYRKGILVQIEKTIPLENIQDVTFIEGPILRQFNLSILKFETAGQSAGQANDMKLIGVLDADTFRKRILLNREKLKQRHLPIPSTQTNDESIKILRAILQRLDEIATAIHKPV